MTSEAPDVRDWRHPSLQDAAFDGNDGSHIAGIHGHKMGSNDCETSAWANEPKSIKSIRKMK